MARSRLLKPGFFANETLTEIQPFGRLLFAGLWILADREGRLPDRPKWIKGQLFPFENVPVEKLLSELETLGFISRYEAEDQRCILVSNFDKHQKPHKNEAPSSLPPPLKSGEESRLTPPESTEESRESARTRAQAPPRDPVSVSDPVSKTVSVSRDSPQGSRGHPLKEIDNELVTRFSAEFPLANVAFEAEQFRDYCQSGKGKYSDHIAAFRKWVRKANQDAAERRNGIQTSQRAYAGSAGRSSSGPDVDGWEQLAARD